MTSLAEKADLREKAVLKTAADAQRHARIERQLRLCVDSGERPVLKEIAQGLGVHTSLVGRVWRAMGGGSLVRRTGGVSAWGRR